MSENPSSLRSSAAESTSAENSASKSATPSGSALVFPSRRPFWVAFLAAAAPLLMLGLSQVSLELMTVCAGVLILGFAIGWGRLTSNPSPWRTGILVFLVGEVGLLLTRLTQNLSWISLVIAIGLVAAFFSEMTRGIKRPRSAWSLAVNVTGIVIVAAAAAWGLTSVYPTMSTLAVASLPATGVASLLIAVPCKRPWLRTLMCAIAGGIISAILTFTYLQSFPDLALAVPYAVLNPQAGIWIMTVGLGILCGVLVACVDISFPIPKAKGYHWQQLTLALMPTLFLAVVLYALSRMITG